MEASLAGPHGIRGRSDCTTSRANVCLQLTLTTHARVFALGSCTRGKGLRIRLKMGCASLPPLRSAGVDRLHPMIARQSTEVCRQSPASGVRRAREGEGQACVDVSRSCLRLQLDTRARHSLCQRHTGIRRREREGRTSE